MEISPGTRLQSGKTVSLSRALRLFPEITGVVKKSQQPRQYNSTDFYLMLPRPLPSTSTKANVNCYQHRRGLLAAARNAKIWNVGCDQQGGTEEGGAEKQVIYCQRFNYPATGSTWIPPCAHMQPDIRSWRIPL